eukprot:768550-Hanusia_phi.AAC.6
MSVPLYIALRLLPTSPGRFKLKDGTASPSFLPGADLRFPQFFDAISATAAPAKSATPIALYTSC